jgi:hemoglobin
MTLDLSPLERRAQIMADITAKTGIDDQLIERVVRGFYARIQADPLLAPIFTNRITDWEPHLRRMVEFWSSVTIMSGRYHGNPMAKHRDMPVTAVHFTRWLALFRETVQDLCPPEAQMYFIERAERIAQSLSMGIDDHKRDAAMAPVLAKSGATQ